MERFVQGTTAFRRLALKEALAMKEEDIESVWTLLAAAPAPTTAMVLKYAIETGCVQAWGWYDALATRELVEAKDPPPAASRSNPNDDP